MIKRPLVNVFCVSALSSLSFGTIASAEDRGLVKTEKGIMTTNTYTWSSSQNGTYAQQGTWEEQIARDTGEGFNTYLGAMKTVATVAGNAPVNDVVPGVGRGRKSISKDVNQNIDKISDMFGGPTQ